MSQESFFSKKIFIKNKSKLSPYHCKLEIEAELVRETSSTAEPHWNKKRQRCFFEIPPCPQQPILNFSDFAERNLNWFLPLQECPLIQTLSSLGKTYFLLMVKNGSGKGFMVLPEVQRCLVKFRKNTKWVLCLTSFAYIILLGALPIKTTYLNAHINSACDCSNILIVIS